MFDRYRALQVVTIYWVFHRRRRRRRIRTWSTFAQVSPSEVSDLSRVTGTRGRSFGTVCLDGQDGSWEAVCRLDLVCYDSKSHSDCQMTELAPNGLAPLRLGRGRAPEKHYEYRQQLQEHLLRSTD